jgi:hypothetical protein
VAAVVADALREDCLEARELLVDERLRIVPAIYRLRLSLQNIVRERLASCKARIAMHRIK